MNTPLRKRSPRAPSMALEDAVGHALKIYEKERRHPVPADVVAQHMGYKDAKNGAALSAVATLGYYGLVERGRDGLLSVSKDVELYKFAPDDDMRNELRLRWLKAPSLFAELLDKYHDGLPSDASIRFALINKGFNESTAETCMSAFRQSVEFARYYDRTENEVSDDVDVREGGAREEPASRDVRSASPAVPVREAVVAPAAHQSVSEDVDRIPVRLSGGRKAWIEIPAPFYAADKARLIRQIELLLTEEEEEGDAGTSAGL